MKDSGIQWIGKIPDNWRVIRSKYVAVTYTGNSIKDEEKYMYEDEEEADLYVATKDVDAHTGNIIEHNSLYIKKTDDNFVRAYENDILMCIEGGSAGKKKTFLNRTVCFVNKLCCFHPYGIFPKYLYFILSSPHYENEFLLNVTGLIGGVSKNKLNNFYYPLPSFAIQEKIAAFLNKKSAEIDALIEVENKQIEKLKEYKQAVITEAVTKGLDKSAPMKDSGVDWIGMIPQDWEVIKAKFIADSFEKGSGITKEDVVVDGDSPCVRYGEIYTKYNHGFSHCFTRTNLANVSSPTYFEYGDILFTCTGELVEEIGKNVVYIGEEKCLAGGDIIIMKHKQEPRFLNYAMNCICSQMQKSYGKAKLKVVHISAYSIGSVYIALPDINTQKKIADFIDKKIADIDSLIEIKQKKIDELNEYKKSLIYEYVTGKKEVV